MAILSPKGYLIMSTDIFWLSQLESAIGISLVEVRDPGKRPKVHKRPKVLWNGFHNKKLSDPKCQ